MKVAVVQFKASTYKDQNLERIKSFIKEAASNGATLCAFPEYMMFYTNSNQTAAQLASMAESINGNFVKGIADAAKRHHIQIVGSIYEKSNNPNRVYDTSFIMDKTGRVISSYKKIHLYDALGFKESAKMLPGSRIAKPVNTSLGKTGMLICYDLRFPEMSRSLAVAGAKILVAPSAWVKGELKEEHWVALNRTRAIENGCYVIAPDHTGHIYCGCSMVVDPYGRILFKMTRTQQGIRYADIDPQIITQTRKSLPLLKSMRTDAYTPIA